MLVKSAKAKGRRAQDEVVAELQRKIYLPHGCHEDDVKPVTMGIPGVDVILTPAARSVADLLIECKNVEKLNIGGTFLSHYDNYENKPGLKLLAHKRNRTPMLATLLFSDLVDLIAEVTNARRSQS